MKNSEVTLPLVLIIDDDPTVHLWAKRHLSIAGFRLVSALNGEEGIAIFQTCCPDVVLIDVEMPGKDGFTTCSEIRRLPNGKNIPILMVTGTEDAERVALSFEAGATDFVVKPINWKVLMHRLEYMIKASGILHQLEQSQSRLSKAQKMAKLGNWEMSIADYKLHWSDEIYAIFEQNPDSFSAHFNAFLDLVHDNDKLLVIEAFEKALRNKTPLTFDYRLNIGSVDDRYVEQQIEMIFNAQNQLTGLTGTIQDISERKVHEQQVRHLAYYDEITSLPNRACFLNLLAKALELAKRNQRLFAVLFMDLDGFKAINDSFGHQVGDLLLQEVAAKISEGLRRSDIASRYSLDQHSSIDVARLGGDEFTILLNELTQPEDAAIVAANIQKWLGEITAIDENQIVIAASIGIAIYPQDGNDCEELLKNADIAMYHAKKAGKGHSQFFHEDMNLKVKKRQKIESCMQQALSNNELRLYYQPVVNAATGMIIGAEALMRWESAQLGFLPPMDFIPLAEENGFIIKFGEWAIREACRQHKQWQKQGMGYLTIAVNLSSSQFNQANFIPMVQAILDEYAVDPGFLVFELTETILMADTQKVVDALWKLKEMGIKLSVDDFGVGYSSLSYLKKFPLDTLKIDRSFVKDIPGNLDDVAIVKAILMLANTLSLHTVAEGVENEQQREFLVNNNCDAIQGFLFAKPMPVDEFKHYWQAQADNKRSETCGI
ncbi:MAG: EAL domain-containing protein [Methylococcaceae bacterium]|nr:EAL domain-containing protein [Methylococcaceae bacterium]